MIRPLGARANMQSIICIMGSVPSSGCSSCFPFEFGIDYVSLSVRFGRYFGLFFIGLHDVLLFLYIKDLESGVILRY